MHAFHLEVHRCEVNFFLRFEFCFKFYALKFLGALRKFEMEMSMFV